MIVKMQNRGRTVTGLQIGPRNVRRYFREKVQSVELELGDLRIECELKPGFWRNHPEITDPRLCAWLEAKNARREPRHAPGRVAMFPGGNGSFRLQLVRSRPDGEHPVPRWRSEE
jgi:hypothetical protein